MSSFSREYSSLQSRTTARRRREGGEEGKKGRGEGEEGRKGEEERGPARPRPQASEEVGRRNSKAAGPSAVVDVCSGSRRSRAAVARIASAFARWSATDVSAHHRASKPAWAHRPLPARSGSALATSLESSRHHRSAVGPQRPKVSQESGRTEGPYRRNLCSSPLRAVAPSDPAAART